MKTHIRRQQHKNVKHQDIKQKEPPQKYRLGNPTLSISKHEYWHKATFFLYKL